MSADAATTATPMISLRRNGVRIAWTPLTVICLRFRRREARMNFFPPAIAHETHDAVKTAAADVGASGLEGRLSERRRSNLAAADIALRYRRVARDVDRLGTRRSERMRQ